MNKMWNTAIVIAAVSATLGAQSGKEKEMDHSTMGGTTTMTYTGCVETVNHGAIYLLTHVDDHPMTMSHDGMKKDSAMAMKDASAQSSDMHDGMMPIAIVLKGAADLKKHVGQKVTVNGPVSKEPSNGAMKNEVNTLTVGSLKVVGKTCK